MTRTRAARTCPICDRDFAPTREQQRACGFKCARTLAGRTLKAKGTPAALTRQQAVNAARCRTRVDRACAEHFGDLTPRELNLFVFAEADGYNRGYTRGYTARRRSGLKAGAA